MRRVVPLLALIALGAVVESCKEPTQILLEARSNVQYRPGIVTTFTVGSPGQTEHQFPTAVSDAPWDGSLIGTLVIIPGSSDEAAR